MDDSFVEKNTHQQKKTAESQTKNQRSGQVSVFENAFLGSPKRVKHWQRLKQMQEGKNLVLDYKGQKTWYLRARSICCLPVCDNCGRSKWCLDCFFLEQHRAWFGQKINYLSGFMIKRKFPQLKAESRILMRVKRPTFLDFLTFSVTFLENPQLNQLASDSAAQRKHLKIDEPSRWMKTNENILSVTHHTEAIARPRTLTVSLLLAWTCSAFNIRSEKRNRISTKKYQMNSSKRVITVL